MSSSTLIFVSVMEKYPHLVIVPNIKVRCLGEVDSCQYGAGTTLETALLRLEPQGLCLPFRCVYCFAFGTKEFRKSRREDKESNVSRRLPRKYRLYGAKTGRERFVNWSSRLGS